MDKMFYTRNCIYKAQSKLTGKIYIGKTQTFFKDRYRGHKRDSQNLTRTNRLYRHIQKYGWKDMEWSVVYTMENQEELTWKEKEQLGQKEIEYIALYDSFNTGLNGSLGGDGKPMVTGRKNSSEYMKQKWTDPEYRKQMIGMVNTEENRQKILSTRQVTGKIKKQKVKLPRKHKPKNIVYKATSLATGLIYIGATSRGLAKTITSTNKQSINATSKFATHIKRYGIDDLKYEILELFHTQEKLNSNQQQELRNVAKKYITEYKTETEGLNTAPTDITEETRQKVGYASAHRDPSTRAKLSQASKGRSNPRKGTGMSEEEKQSKQKLKQEQEKLERRARGLLVNKFTDQEVQPVIDMIRSGLKRNHIMRKGVSASLYSKAKRTIGENISDQFTEEKLAPVRNMIQSGLKRRQILAQGIPENLYSKARYGW